MASQLYRPLDASLSAHNVDLLIQQPRMLQVLILPSRQVEHMERANSSFAYCGRLRLPRVLTEPKMLNEIRLIHSQHIGNFRVCTVQIEQQQVLLGCSL